MKRKRFFNILKLFMVVCLIIPCCFGLSACKDGQTPYIGANGNWFIGSTDTGVKAGGTDGTNGIDGKDAEPVDTYEIYQKAVEHENYQGSYLDFIKEYFTVTTDITSAVANECVMSVVEVKAYNSTSQVNTGSGVIYQIDNNGNALVLTNYHVVVGSGTVPRVNYSLRLYGQQENTYISASFVGGSSTYDIAVLKVEQSEILKTSNAKAITLNTNSPSLGENCIAIGNPDTYGVAVSKGIVSKDSEYVYMSVAGEQLPRRLIRHDAYISGGSSGGGLFDINGHLIGLTCGGKDGTDIHYAIPASIIDNVVNSVLRNIESGGTRPTTALLGIETTFSANSFFNSSTGKVEIVDTITISAISESLILTNGNLSVGDKLTSITLYPDTADEKQITLTREYQLKEILLTIQSNTTIKISAIHYEPTDDIDVFVETIVSATVTITASEISIVK